MQNPAPLSALFAIPALLIGFASQAWADTPLTAEEFDAYTQGKTILYSADGRPVGAETYLRNRRVRWSFLQEDCQDGYWYPQDTQICFVYDALEGPQCWTFTLRQGRLHAEFIDGGSPLIEETADHNLTCLGPEIGV